MRRILMLGLLAVAPFAYGADVAISALASASSPLAGTEVVPVVQSGVTRKVTLNAITNRAIAPTTVTTGTVTSTSSIISTGTITTSSPAISAAQTWNNSGTTFTAAKVNVTNSASASGSLLLDLQVAGTSKVNVDLDGKLGLGNNITLYSWGNNLARMDGNMYATSYSLNSGVAAVNDTGLALNKDGLLFWTNGFNPGNTKDISLSRNTAKVLELNSGTPGTYAGGALVLGPQTVAQLPTCASGTQGARATATDATSTTFLATLTGSGSNIVPAFCNGTAWLIG